VNLAKRLKTLTDALSEARALGYHITPERNARSVLKRGLDPSPKQGTVLAEPNGVYFFRTPKEALKHAKDFLKWRNEEAVVVFEAQLETRSVFHDEHEIPRYEGDPQAWTAALEKAGFRFSPQETERLAARLEAGADPYSLLRGLPARRKRAKGNLRTTEPVGYRGANRILGAIRLPRRGPASVVYGNPSPAFRGAFKVEETP
jgi:hypothetical protein